MSSLLDVTKGLRTVCYRQHSLSFLIHNIFLRRSKIFLFSSKSECLKRNSRQSVLVAVKLEPGKTSRYDQKLIIHVTGLQRFESSTATLSMFWQRESYSRFTLRFFTRWRWWKTREKYISSSLLLVAHNIFLPGHFFAADTTHPLFKHDLI